MKAYVIKNKEGKYWQWLFNDEPDWEEELYNAFLHYSKEDAKRNIIDWQLKDCEVVEITIAEGDLEQQLADKEVKIEVLERDADNLYRTLEEANEELADKDKEIVELRQTIIDLYNTNINLEMYSKIIRRQVCEEIREKLLMLCDWYEDAIDGYWYATAKKINYVLDRVEKGE